jgi:opacity protein-like surface antigen
LRKQIQMKIEIYYMTIKKNKYLHMKYKNIFLCLLMVFISSLEIKAQTMPNKSIYLAATAGLARSEDGLKFLIKSSASQWTPMLNIGFGFRINKYLGIEFNTATMLTKLKAEGILVSNSENAMITTKHSSLIISPIFHFPISSKSEIFLRTGGGVLFSTSKINSFSNPNFKKSTSNIGYMITLGYAQKLSDRLTLTVQFDFSDAYGSKDVWEGDLGLLNIGVKYNLNNKK